MPKLQVRAAQPAIPNLRPLTDRLTAFGNLMALVHPVPKKWLKTSERASGNGVKIGKAEPQGLSIRSCDDVHELINAWRVAYEWSEGLDSALIVMLASSMTTQFVGEQLWIKIMGPPSCGKTSLMEGLATATKYYLSKDTIRGFHSGWKEEDDEDVSLAAMCKGKTLGIKDGDTLLKAPNLGQILSEGRALYDRVSRTNYRNAVNRSYVGHRMTWHLAGTNSLREIDDSELGARFLDVVVMDSIDHDFERKVGARAARKEALNMLKLSEDDNAENQHDDDEANAMALSGGFLTHLRDNALEISKGVTATDRALERCDNLGRFTAHMRARPPKQRHTNVEDADREFSARLTKQLTRLCVGSAAVLGKHDTDDECCQRVHKVAMDTSRGFTLDLMHKMVDKPKGMEIRGLSALIHSSEDRLQKYLLFLRKIGVMETDVNRRRWRVTPNMVKLYYEVQNP